MAIKLFNSVAGFAVGEIPANIILANGDITTTNITTTGISNLNSVSNVKISGGTSGQYLQTDGSGNLVWATVSGGSNISNGNSNVNIPVANGNVNISVVGNANVLVITGTGVNVAGTLNATGNANVGNLGVTRVLASSNITAPQLISNVANGTAPFVVTSATQVANLNAATAGSATTAGTVTTAAQPNITSVGTLTSLTVTGNVTGGNLVTTGKVYSADFINGGTGIYLSAGPSGYINFFTTSGDKASISDTGNIIASNLIANSTIFAVTANVSGNVNAGNANLGNLATANFFIGNGSQLTGITASQGSNIANGSSNVNIPAANGNVTISAAGNANILVVTGTGANVAGTLNATGNVNGANFVSSSYLIRSVGANIVATGSSQGTATALTKEFNLISTVTAGTGVALPNAVAGMAITVINNSANALLVYPAVNGIINSQAANAAYTQPASATLQFVALNATQWYTVGANTTQRIGMFATTTPTASEPLALYSVPNAQVFPANFAGSTGSIATGGANPAASFVMSVFKNATQVGTITVSTSGVFSFATTDGLTQSVAAGDVIRILGPATPDTTIANFAATLLLGG